jgi:hypothetical protein
VQKPLYKICNLHPVFLSEFLLHSWKQGEDSVMMFASTQET